MNDPKPTLPQRRLWCAVVGHTSEPGNQLAFFHQVQEPADFLIKARFSDVAKAKELTVDGLFNLSAVLSGSVESASAFKRGALASQQGAPEELGGARLWFAMVDHCEVPGTRLEVFYQPTEPTDAQIFARLEDVDSSELEVVWTFDVTHALKANSHGAHDRLAIEKEYNAAFAPSAAASPDGGADAGAQPSRRQSRP
jgi:hypothetical protein